MNTLRKAAEQALEALRHITEDSSGVTGAQIVRDVHAALVALRAALQREALNEVHQSDHEQAHVAAAVAAAVKAEREACLAVVYDYPVATLAGLKIKQGIAAAIRAEAIRARGEQP